ncbi:MAG: DUF5107 domain-containing protein [Eubacteriales bacterium]|nr:DUF5107 domain-containing protein [Christensenellaceae bacterium]MEA5065341.1 DUF5107 domain-containing protein [Eubacteriales bacterium]
MRIEKTQLILPAARVLGASPLPAFRAAEDKPILDGGLLTGETPGFARDTGFRVLPYAMQDVYDPIPEERAVPSVEMENDRLKAVFLPGLGGRLYSLFDKRAGRELLFCNPVIKMGNLALRNAWFSGGVEWNLGHFGHTPFTCEDVFFAECEADGQRFVRMYVYERMKRLTFQIDFHLGDGAPHLTAHMRVYNRGPESAPLFLWTNAAVPEDKGPRIFSGTDQVIVQAESETPGESRFLHAALPFPFPDGVDHTHPARIPHAEEYFFQNPADARYAFESALYADGRITYERSTGNYPYRKLFCWGGHAGGKRWQEHLSRPGEGAYVEIQAGCWRTQQHAGTIGAGETFTLTQMFGGARAPYERFSGPYHRAREAMQALIDDCLPAEAVEREHARCERYATVPVTRILHEGTGWGALEKMRSPGALPEHLDFPAHTIGPEQAPWAALLRGERFPGADSFMTAPEWLRVCQAALAERPDDAQLWTHAGIALYENGDWAGAKAAWSRAAELVEAPLALRNLSFAAARDGDREAALAFMERAVNALAEPERAYAEEYLALLNDAGQYAKAWAFYRGLPEALQAGERMSINASFAALEMGEDAFLDRQFARTFSVVKEGELDFIALWFRREALRAAKARGIAYTPALLEEVRRTAKLPRNLDFRMLS